MRKDQFTIESPAAAVLAAVFVLLFFVDTALGEVRYSIDCNIDIAASTLSGNVRIVLSGPDIPQEDFVFLSTPFGHGRSLEIIRATVSGQPVSVSRGAGRAALFLPEAVTGDELILEIDFRLAAVPEAEGIILLDDNLRGGRRSCWYPRVADTASHTARFEVTLTLDGPGIAAHSAPNQMLQEGIGRRVYRLEDPAAASFVIALSPIFVEQRAIIGGCDLGLFVREGSERWSENLMAILAEIYNHYAERIPGFEYSRLDVVLAGHLYQRGDLQSSIVIIEDELDQMAERFGGVFAANYARWRASVELAQTFWGSRIRQEEGAIPWLREGLVLHFAEGYADISMLGGPAFDNIRQFYLNAARGEFNTSLSQTVAEADGSGLDSQSVLAQSKGLWVVGMLRQKIGRPAWSGFVRELARPLPDRILTNDSIQSLAEDASGDLLEHFFNDWIRGDARLDYAIGRVRREDTGTSVQILARGNARPAFQLRAVFENGSEQSRVVEAEGAETWLRFDETSQLYRVEIDPDRTLPDLNRGDNLRSFGTAERIELLYSIDKIFDIGEVLITSSPARRGEMREAKFELTIQNLTDKPRDLGVWLTSRFPGGRNRALTRLFLEFSPRETLTVRDELAFPEKGLGLAELRADYFLVTDREGFERVIRRTQTDLTNYYVVLVEDE